MPNLKPKLSDLPLPENADNILSGPIYRFLPVKVGVRVLSNMYTQQLPEVRDFYGEDNQCCAAHSGISLQDWIEWKEDSFGELLSASFPTNDEKSIKRFVNHYMLYLRTSDMTLLGMMPELKLINVVSIKRTSLE